MAVLLDETLRASEKVRGTKSQEATAKMSRGGSGILHKRKMFCLPDT